MIHPRAALGLWLLGLLLALLLAPLLGRLEGSGLLGIMLLEVICFALPPIAYAATLGPPATVLRLGPARPRALLGAALVGACAWLPLVTLLMPLQQWLAPMPADLARQLADAPRGPLLPVLVAVAVTPALCEELLCRGALLFSLRSRMSGPVAVVVSAALFALLHLSPYRLLPTFLLGILFGAVSLRAGSIVPGMLAHALNNACVVLASRFEAPDVPAFVVQGVAVGGLTYGLLLTLSSAQRQRLRPNEKAR